MLARAIAALLILAPFAAYTHGGGLDDLGCHHTGSGGVVLVFPLQCQNPVVSLMI